MQIDKNLIVACFRQEKKALYRLYKSCYSPLLSILIRYESNKENAKELVNDCFLEIVNNLERLKELEEKSIAAWIKTVAIRKAISQYRKQKKIKNSIRYVDFQDPLQENEQYDNFSFTYNEAESKLTTEDLDRMIASLHEDHRIVFNLAVIDGLPHQEIAEIFGISESTSRAYLSLARKQLKQLIAQEINKKVSV